MNVSITDQMVSQFLSGFIVVVLLIAIGGFISMVLHRMARPFPFTRLALILGLAPLSLVNFLEYGGSSTLYLYAMGVAMLGITIDGINHLLLPKEKIVTVSKKAKSEEEEKEEEPRPGVIVWEKTE